MIAASAVNWPAPISATETWDLTVVVDNLRSAKGRVRVALWFGPDGFTKPEAAIINTGQTAQRGQVQFDFKGLPAGRYAVASYHDENGNGKFDQTWVGLPDEGLGFSNGVWIGFGPPVFEDAAVEVGAEDKTIVVSLRY